jgi:hypothetical protein
MKRRSKRANKQPPKKAKQSKRREREKKLSAERSKRAYQKLCSDPARKAARDEQMSKVHHLRNVKKLAERLQKGFEDAFSSQPLEQGVVFVVPKMFNLSKTDRLFLKNSVKTRKGWDPLKNKDRLYMPNPTQAIVTMNTFVKLREALTLVFQDKIRLDRLSWNVHSFKLLRHNQALNVRQGFHVDIKKDLAIVQENLHGPQQLSYWNFGGFSVFVGIEKKNFLYVAELDESNKRIHNVKREEFPVNSILVISSHRVHAASPYVEGTIFTKPKLSKFSLKGFMSIHGLGAESGFEQGWFDEYQVVENEDDD